MYKRKHFPEKGEFVICTIKNLLPHSVFVELDEFENKEGMIHVSEIARKWIRNLKTYMKVGAKVVCKVMDVDEKKGHINLSVRRVGASQKRMKQIEWSNEKRANDILEVFAKQNKLTAKGVYDKIGNKILEKYGLLYPVFLEVSKQGSAPLEDANIETNLVKKVTELIQKRIIPPKAEIEGILDMISNSSEGLEVIKTAIEKAENIAKKFKVKFELQYLGAPKYKFKITADDFKIAENALKEIKEQLRDYLKANKGTIEFKRT